MQGITGGLQMTGETCKVHRLRTPAMLLLTHPSHHITQNPNPQQQATATGPRYHNTRHMTQLPPRPQTHHVT
jgi:hypothetical protein